MRKVVWVTVIFEDLLGSYCTEDCHPISQLVEELLEWVLLLALDQIAI